MPGTIPKRRFGRADEEVSILGLGGAHVARNESDRDAVALVRLAVDEGVTFLDNAWEYHEGRAEELYGKALQDGYRERVFLMTKHHGRDRETALRHLDESLKRMRTDVIDLWQFHEIIYEDDPEMIFARGGAIEAAVEAKEAGKVRYIGFTGHKDPRILRKMLDHAFEWDSVQMPLNVLDANFRSFQDDLVGELVGRGIAVLAMKTMAAGGVLETGAISVEEGLNYVWSLPVTTIVSGMHSPEILQENVRAARSYTAMNRDEREEIAERVRSAAETGEYERYKSARDFDSRHGRELHEDG
ncbi:MAG: aldo/keto reductase [Candidatus Eisenbacteria bacterium]|nr:aldo/keto reductase [Candidatus Eisenbacteria bacterium]